MSIVKPAAGSAISVIIPTFSAGKIPSAPCEYLEGAIRSVLAQSLPPAHVFIVEDGGAENPESAIAALVTRLTPAAGKTVLRYLTSKRFGTPAGPRNVGIRAALDVGSKYIAFLDHDDLWLPDKLARQYDALESDLEIQAVHTNAEYLFPASHIERAAFARFRPTLSETFAVLDGIADAESVLRCYTIFSTVIIRPDFFNRMGLLDETLSPCDDMDLLLRLAQMRARVAFVPEVSARYRLSAKSLSMQRDRVLDAKTRVIQKHLSGNAAEPDRLALESAAHALARRRAYAAFNDGEYAKARDAFRALRRKSFKDALYAAALATRCPSVILLSRGALTLVRR